ncbi:hypothetical protein QTO34_016305 [Cnephaeus nilssonii]|uniref:Cytosolic fatty-acid binding proteins domain-containing protein n=1 Tax=Cnephaeus nilssonii TaxID=3371016 RepID=A0AA40I5R9_CNENI|nr:hypothetical protein QTO34_016305 [Eptesicus nilssonii]
MAFNGKYEIESEKNYDEFMKRLALPWGHSMTNKFTIGKECDMETMGGKKFKATVQMEGGKVVVDFPNYHQTSEIVGGKLVEISTIGGVTYERVSKRLA